MHFIPSRFLFYFINLRCVRFLLFQLKICCFNSESCWLLALPAFIKLPVYSCIPIRIASTSLMGCISFFLSSPSLSLTDFNFYFSSLLPLGRPLTRSNDDQKHKHTHKHKHHKLHNCLCAACSYTRTHTHSRLLKTRVFSFFNMSVD